MTGGGDGCYEAALSPSVLDCFHFMSHRSGSVGAFTPFSPAKRDNTSIRKRFTLFQLKEFNATEAILKMRKWGVVIIYKFP